MGYRNREHGLMLLDAMVGMTIVGMLMGVLAVAMSHQRHSASLLSKQRRLERLAEGVLIDLQQGVEPAAPTWDAETQPIFTVKALADTPAPCDSWAWVEVAAGYEDLNVSVIGIVPEQSQALMGGVR